MIEIEADRIRTAFRKAVQAIDELRGVLAAAGLFDAVEAAVQAPVETPEERRRRLARERSRRRRERDVVTPKRDATVGASRRKRDVVTVERDASVTKRDVVTLERDADGAPASRTGAFLIEEEFISTSPLFATQTVPPADDVTRSRHAGSVTSPAAPVAPVPAELAPTASVSSTPPKAKGRKRAAVAPGSTIGGSDGSPAVPVSDRAPAGAGGGSGPGADVGQVWAAYLQAIAPTRARLTAAREALIVRRLREYSVDEILRSIGGYGRSAFHRGENDRGQAYQAIELWLRDAAHVEAGWRYLDARPPVGKAAQKKGAPDLDGMNAEWEKIEARLEAERAAAEIDVFAEE